MACPQVLNAYAAHYRFIILFFNCLLTFGSYFCFDMPSVLQAQFQGVRQFDSDSVFHYDMYYVKNNSCVVQNSSVPSSNSSCCSDCLGLTADEYNLVYAVYAWSNAIVVIAAGFLVDKLGNRVGVLLFSTFCVVGSAIFASATLLQGSSWMLPMLLIARLLFGAGNGSLTIVQNRITAFWFAGKELALAFGVTLAFSRLGSVLNFFLTQSIYNAFGLPWTLGAGSLLCVMGFVSAVLVSALDIKGVRQLGREAEMVQLSRKVHFSDIRYFASSFWCLAATIMFFYNGIFPFVADASKFIQDKYGYDPMSSAYLAGAVYDVSLVMSPFLGGYIDYTGKRGILAVVCTVMTIPVYGLLAFTSIHPLVSTVWLGTAYSLATACLWPSIPLVVSYNTVGTAMGVASSLQMIGVGVANLIVGEILGKDEMLTPDAKLWRWKLVMIFLLINMIFGVMTAVMLNVADRRKGGILNLSVHQIKQIMSNVEHLAPVADETPYQPIDADAIVEQNYGTLPNSVPGRTLIT